MKVAAYSIGGIERASARLRSFYLFNCAKDSGLNVSRPSRYRDALSCDVVHIQKLLTYRLLFWVLIYRIFGLTVVFDIDDNPGGLKSSLGYLAVMSLSSIITVDSDARRAYLRKFLFFKKIVVINDIADTKDFDLRIREPRKSTDGSGFFWIGHSSNLPSIEGLMQVFKTSPHHRLIVSIEKEAIAPLEKRYPSIRFMPWFDGIAFDTRIDARFMVLNHDFNRASLLKSDNKMVLAILAGFVPIVSRTPAYETLAKSLHADFLLFDDIEEVTSIAAKLAETDFQIFFERALDFINLNYSRKAVLSDFDTKVLRRRTPPRTLAPTTHG